MRGTSVFAAAVALMLAPMAPAQTFTKIVDTLTPIPGGSGTFIAFASNGVSPNQVAANGGNVIFPGAGSGGQQGFYSSTSQGLTRIVDTSTSIPNGTGTFTVRRAGASYTVDTLTELRAEF